MGDILRALFSGRFDSAHLGHWATILKLCKIFDSVLVVILDYEGREYPASYIRRVYETLAALSVISLRELDFRVNTTHFAEISKSEWQVFGCDIYAGSNETVNEHMTTLGVPVYDTGRSFDFSARNYKKEAKS